MSSFLLLVILTSTNASFGQGTESEPRKLEERMAAGSEETLSAILDLGSASVPSLCDLLLSHKPFRGFLGSLKNPGDYVIEIAEDDLERIQDTDLQATMRQLAADNNTIARRQVTVGEASAYLLTAILRKDSAHAPTPELVDLEGQELPKHEIQERLAGVHQILCGKSKMITADSLEKSLPIFDLQHDPRTRTPKD